jgi:hypothetical protein
MAEREYETSTDELERSTLQKAISDVERVIANSVPGTQSFLQVFLQNAKGRVDALDKKIKDAQVERETHAREAVVIAQMVEREKALNAQEKETFGCFLKKDFFTKSDFGSLEKFYAKTWDKLSDEGKDAMSHRFWEGIRRDQYSFGAAPKDMREKETDWAYTTLVKRENVPSRAGKIPEKDRQDFIRAYEAGEKEESQKILERDSFKQHLFRGAESNGEQQIHAERGRDKEGKVVGAAIASAPSARDEPRETEGDSRGPGFSKLKLDGLRIAEATKEASVSDMPGKTGSGKSGPLIRGGG